MKKKYLAFIDEQIKELAPKRKIKDDAVLITSFILGSDKEFFDLKIPLLLVAGGSDEVVDFNRNSNKVIEYCRDNDIALEYYVKPDCKHHPHSLTDVSPIIKFITDCPQ